MKRYPAEPDSLPPDTGPAPGEYCIALGSDSKEQRAEGKRIMREQGCQSIRYDRQANGTMLVHGYLRDYPQLESTAT